MMELYKKRISRLSGSAQDNMIKNKQKTLKTVIDNSYFGFDVTKPEETENIKYKVLITSNDDDEQNISSFFENEIKVGSIIHWLKTDTYWLVHEQNVNEIAFFEGAMIECKNFQIVTEDGKFSTWGRIAYKSDDSEVMFDQTLVHKNESVLQIWIPNIKANKAVFKLNCKINVLDQVWKINSVDYISKNGILIIEAEKSQESANVDIQENEINNDNTYIDGPNFISPLEEVTYSVVGDIKGEWSIPDNKNLQKVINSDGSITIVWINNRKRQDFTISYGDYSKEIHVQSMM